jgi:hypothetical protein
MRITRLLKADALSGNLGSSFAAIVNRARIATVVSSAAFFRSTF